MTKLSLAMMCVCLSAAALVGCTSSTMPAPNDPATAIHEEPIMAGPSNQSVAAAAPQKAPLTESATAAK